MFQEKKVRVVGAGLIGTSIALRLREIGWAVDVDDPDLKARTLARDLLGLSCDQPDAAPAELVIICTPPDATFEVLKLEYETNPQATFIDVSSVKNNLQVEVEGLPEIQARFIGTHPIAGREVSGAESARSDLFDGRAWILTPSHRSSETMITKIESLMRDLGAVPYRMSSRDHDLLMARISHLPQLLSVALALTVSRIGNQIELAGGGLRDMLRLAGSKGSLWSEIFLANETEVVTALAELQQALEDLQRSILQRDRQEIEDSFDFANSVYSSLSGKHGARPREYVYLNIVIEDKPGQLGALFNECGAIQANVEDLALEHSPRQESGLIRLALSADDAMRLHSHLISKGWKAHFQ